MDINIRSENLVRLVDPTKAVLTTARINRACRDFSILPEEVLHEALLGLVNLAGDRLVERPIHFARKHARHYVTHLIRREARFRQGPS